MRTIVIAAALALALGACAKKEKGWVKEGADANAVRSAIYWCSRVRTEKYQETNSRNIGVRRSETVVDEECMKKRGFRYE